MFGCLPISVWSLIVRWKHTFSFRSLNTTSHAAWKGSSAGPGSDEGAEVVDFDAGEEGEVGAFCTTGGGESIFLNNWILGGGEYTPNTEAGVAEFVCSGLVLELCIGYVLNERGILTKILTTEVGGIEVERSRLKVSSTLDAWLNIGVVDTGAGLKTPMDGSSFLLDSPSLSSLVPVHSSSVAGWLRGASEVDLYIDSRTLFSPPR